MRRIKNLLRDESGVETVEYAFVAAAIALLAAIAYASGIGDLIYAKMTGII